MGSVQFYKTLGESGADQIAALV
jgi:hypothetical protein